MAAVVLADVAVLAADVAVLVVDVAVVVAADVALLAKVHLHPPQIN